MLSQDRKRSEGLHEEVHEDKPAQEAKVQEQQKVEPIPVAGQSMTAINEEQRRLIEEVLREYLA